MAKFGNYIFMIGLIILLTVSESEGIGPPETLYVVEVGERDLVALKGDLQRQGWGPLVLEQQPSGFQLMLGQWEYYVDAMICALQLQSAYGLPARVVAIENVKGIVPGGVQGPIRRIFEMPETHMSEVPELILPEGDALVERLRELEKGSDQLSYRRALMEAVHSLPDTDVRKGFAMTRRGVLELLERNFEEALLWLKKVSNGEVAAIRLDRIKAMRRVAWILHQQGRRQDAYQAYREMQSFSASLYSQTQAAVECAGLLMELARSKKGTLEECRRECLKVLEISKEFQDDPDFRQLRATVELMFLETFVHEEKHENAARLADSFIIKYPDRPRELSMALMFQAYAHNSIGNYLKAKEALLQVMKTDWPESPYESWKSRDSHSRWDLRYTAALYLRDFAISAHDSEGTAIADSFLRSQEVVQR